MNLREMEDLLGCPKEHLEFSLWYLKENSLIKPGDNGRFVITVKGVDSYEQSDAAEIEHRLLTAPAEARENRARR
jgi:predicted transcriptional regulator